MLILPVRFVLPRLRDEVVVVPEHFYPRPTRWPGPNPARATDLVGRVWTQILQTAKRNLNLSSTRNVVFNYFTLQYAWAVCPKTGPGPSPARKLRPDVSNGTMMGRIFLTRNNLVFNPV
jgi:hypothetical protein